MSDEPQKQPEAIPESDLVPVAADSSPGSGGLVDSMKSFWRSAMETPALEPIRGWIDKQNDTGAQIVQNERDHNHPVRAGIADAYFHAQKDVTDLLMAASEPQNAALLAATSGTGLFAKSALVKSLLTAYNTYFAWRGSQSLITGRQDHESAMDYANRIAMSGAQAVAGVAGAAGTAASTIDNLHTNIQNHLGLSGDLAAKVAAKVEEASKVEAATQGAVSSTEQIAQGLKESVQGDKGLLVDKMGNIISQATPVVLAEKARVEGLFEALNSKATEPVTTADDLRSEIVNTLKGNGLQDAEIPQRIFNAIPNPNKTTVRALTASELKAAQSITNGPLKGLDNADMRSALVNLGYVPKQVDAIMAVADPQSAATTDISFKALTRVKNDLWDASRAATDGTIRSALTEAHDNVTGIQERYAQDHGFGPAYQAAKRDYAVYKNGLGSGLMSEFIQAQDVADQGMFSRIGKIVSDSGGEQIRSLFRSTGVDTSPINSIIEDQKATSAAAAQRVKEIKAQGAEQVNAIGLNNPILKGESDLQFAGKDSNQIRLDAVRKLTQNARTSGMSNPTAFVQIGVGIVRMMAGSMFGTMQTASGLSRLAIQKALKSPAFQDWIIQESGTGNDLAPMVRKAIAGWGPTLQKMAESSVLPRAIDKAQSQPRKPSAPIAAPIAGGGGRSQ